MANRFDPWSATFALLWYGANSDITKRIDAARRDRGLPSFLESP